MAHGIIAEILSSFDRQQSKYIDFADGVKRLISTLLIDQAIMVHSVTHRCKSRQSLEKKVSRPEKNYSSLEDITDIAAIRITTYFADDVDVIASLIESEFVIDRGESVDKRVYDEPDRFGYLSLHFIAKINPERVALSEYRRFSNLRFEIQIRSILQHAWAEIEHDLGYKSAMGVPANVRRRFARVASLLELADSEFQLIRQSLISYEQKMPQAIIMSPDTVALDLVSLNAILSTDSNARRLDQRVAKGAGNKIKIEDLSLSETVVDRLAYFGIRTISQLEKISDDEASTVEEFARYWMGSETKVLPPGVGVFYLSYVLAWRTGSKEKIGGYLKLLFVSKGEERNNLTSRILGFRGNG